MWSKLGIGNICGTTVDETGAPEFTNSESVMDIHENIDGCKRT